METRVKVVVTLGPATGSREAVEALVEAGVDVFRLNFSHGDHSSHGETLRLIREVAERKGRQVAVLQDISGPKIRLGRIPGGLELKKGDILRLAAREDPHDPYTVTCTLPEIITRARKGEAIFFADGTIRTSVVGKGEDHLELRVENPGLLTSRKGINLPHTDLDISAITPKDRADLAFGARNGVDLVAVSFVNSREDVARARRILRENGADPWLISKIETPRGVEKMEEILEESDGVMIARGDLGIEVGVERVPTIQKRLIHMANGLGRPVIVATQILLSMVNSPYPTRAEVSDIANAVLDGADALMLSDETAVGTHPLRAVETLVRSMAEAEKIYHYYRRYEAGDQDAIAASVAQLCKGIRPAAVISFTRSGATARNIAKYRPRVPVYAVTQSPEVLRRLALVWGVRPLAAMEGVREPELYVRRLRELVLERGLFRPGERLILTMGSIVGKSGATNMIRILDL